MTVMGCASTAGSKPTASVVAAASTVPAANPLGLLSIPWGAQPWPDNTDALMGLVPYINTFYAASSQADEKSQYAQWKFVSGGIEGWINPDGSQQRIAIARFATENGAITAFDDLSSSLAEKPKPWTAVNDLADGAVGAANPQPDSLGNADVDITARVGDYLVDVHEYTAPTPDPAAAKALLLEQVKALKSGS